jgi:hypothetical protein
MRQVNPVRGERQFGKLTLRHGSQLHHLGIGRTHAHTPALIRITTTVTVISNTSYQLIASHTITPDRNDWRNEQTNPGRWPGQPVPMTRPHV